MKSEKNILIAFILNLAFSIFELIGGIITNSVSIMSDAIHDFGDAISIGISFVLEKISKRKPDNTYTYGYARYSIIGATITTVILTVGSILVILGGIKRLIFPENINYNGMIIFAVIGVAVNLLAVYFTKEGDSINQKSVNLHMLEDVLGWVVVLIGSILMKFTDIKALDSLMSIGVAIFILVNCFKNLKNILDVFLEKTPQNISIEELKEHLRKTPGVSDVHHVHVWSMDGNSNYSTLHIVSDQKDVKNLKQKVREELKKHGICHSTIEIENIKDDCLDKECHIEVNTSVHSHHNH